MTDTIIGERRKWIRARKLKQKAQQMRGKPRGRNDRFRTIDMLKQQELVDFGLKVNLDNKGKNAELLQGLAPQRMDMSTVESLLRNLQSIGVATNHNVQIMATLLKGFTGKPLSQTSSGDLTSASNDLEDMIPHANQEHRTQMKHIVQVWRKAKQQVEGAGEADVTNMSTDEFTDFLNTPSTGKATAPKGSKIKKPIGQRLSKADREALIQASKIARDQLEGTARKQTRSGKRRGSF